MSALDTLLSSVKLQAKVYHNGQYCGAWAVDTSGSQKMTFHVVAFGRCMVAIDGNKIELKKGDSIFFPTDAKHRISAVGDTTSEINTATALPMHVPKVGDSTGLICGDFGHDNPVFHRLLQQLPSYILVRSEQLSSSSQIIDLMIRESKLIDNSEGFLLDRLSDCLIYSLLRDNVDAHQGLFAAMAHPQIGAAIDLIHNGEEGETPKIEDLVKAAGMSRSAFADTFKNMVGESPGEYASKWRMTRAYRWLADQQITTFEAALRSGYESESSFSKAFKRIMGEGPGKVRAGK